MSAYLFFNIILVIFGCFLPWVHAAIFVVRLRGIDMMDGKVLLAFAILALLFFLYQTIRKESLRLMAYAAFGIVILAITGLDLYIFYMNQYPIGPGIYLSFLGGAQIFGCSIFYLVSSPVREGK